MKIRPKGLEERSRCGHGIVTDLRGQDQAADRSRAQQVSTANESVEPRAAPASQAEAEHVEPRRPSEQRGPNRR
jgi:hypothetical protein